MARKVRDPKINAKAVAKATRALRYSANRINNPNRMQARWAERSVELRQNG